MLERDPGTRCTTGQPDTVYSIHETWKAGIPGHSSNRGKKSLFNPYTVYLTFTQVLHDDFSEDCDHTLTEEPTLVSAELLMAKKIQ